MFPLNSKYLGFVHTNVSSQLQSFGSNKTNREKTFCHRCGCFTSKYQGSNKTKIEKNILPPPRMFSRTSNSGFGLWKFCIRSVAYIVPVWSKTKGKKNLFLKINHEILFLYILVSFLTTCWPSNPYTTQQARLVHYKWSVTIAVNQTSWGGCQYLYVSIAL